MGIVHSSLIGNRAVGIVHSSVPGEGGTGAARLLLARLLEGAARPVTDGVH